jgi:iron complex transport system permease protein
MVNRNFILKKEHYVLSVLVLLLVSLMFFLLCVGRYPVSPKNVYQIIIQFLSEKSTEINVFESNVVLNIRVPRIMMAVFVGAALSVSGTIYQALFGNPLVSPDILGVSSGAGFGAAFAILLSGKTAIVQSSALIFGILAVAVVLNVFCIKNGGELYILVLSGVIVRSLFDALVSFVKYMADPEEKLPTITMWLMGSLANVSKQEMLTCALIIIPCLVFVMKLRWKLNILSLNADEAKSLGINVRNLRLIMILSATLMTAVTVSVCGIIGWIGLVIPHAARLLFGEDHRIVLPASALLGAIYLLLIDTAARAITAGEIPLSILTAMIGAPFFAVILRRTASDHE